MIAEVVLACTLMAETSGEGYMGRRAVASVIVTRSVERKIPATQVCLQRKQFSCWGTGDEKFDAMERRIEGWRAESPEAWGHCMELAVDIQNGNFIPTIYVNHYYNPKLCSPSWATKLTHKKTIGNHVFGVIEN